MNIFVINGGAGDGGGASFVHLTDFRTARSWVPGILSGILCHGYASGSPLTPEAPLEHGENRDMNDMARCVPEERVATHHVRLNQP